MLSPAEAWNAELEKPSEGFWAAFAARTREPDGVRDATREAVKTLALAVDWAGCLPHLPSGLLGIWAAWRLRPLLGVPSFHRILATQLHAFAHEPRKRRGGLAAIARGSGTWTSIEAAVATRRPSLACGEAHGIAEPTGADFQRLLSLGAADMACMGRKGSMPWLLGDLWERLDRPRATGRRLLALSAWMVAAEPSDRFWHQRAASRFTAGAPVVPVAEPSGDDAGEAAREICDLGLVALLDRCCGRIRAGTGSGDLLSALALAASEKMLDARRDLEGKTSGALVYLAALARGMAASGRPEPYVQAAALVNLFPTDEPEGRVAARPPAHPVADPFRGLLDAVLDAEPEGAMHYAGQVQAERGEQAVLRALAEAASQNDPAFNHAGQLLAVASAAELLPLLAPPVRAVLLTAMAKSLANSQGSGDLGRLADRALAAAQ